MKSNFDFIAPAYDQLAKLVFGRSIVDSQLHFLDAIPDTASVLILGGGTGWLLEELIKRKPDCSVCYIEASARMLQLTHRRKLNDKVTFVHGTENDIPVRQTFDVVITNFYLDLFPEVEFGKVIQKVTLHTTLTSQWIVTDFVNEGKWWQHALLRFMYIFFRNISGVEATSLPAWGKWMLQHQWVAQKSSMWYGDFIKSVVAKRQQVI